MKTRALILPADTPPQAATIERFLLFFDKVVLPSPEDRWVVNEGEISENFGNTTFHWAAQGPYPRIGGYKDRLLDLQGRMSAKVADLGSDSG